MEEKDKLISQEKLKEKENFASHVKELQRFGGFGILATSVNGARNLDPSKKTSRRIFMTQDSKKDDRAALLNRLQLFHDLLSSSEDVSEMIGSAETKADEAGQVLSKNQSIALERTRELEQAYRATAAFFANSESSKIKNLSIVNADLEQLTDLDNPLFIDGIEQEFTENYDRLDLRDNYSFLVIPGYLGSNAVVEKWAKIAHQHKVMLITDFENYEDPDTVMQQFEEANLAGGEIHRSHVIMTCNWLVGREKAEELGEEEHVFVPGSAALAGRLYDQKVVIAQPRAGKKFGGINEADGVNFPLKKSEISDLERLNLVPMVNEYGKVMAFSAKTLFNGDNLGLQTYSVVQVFDHMTKTLMDFLNRRAFENINTKMLKDIRGQIVKFLDDNKGPGKLIEDFRILKFDKLKGEKDRVDLQVYLVPYFCARTFVISMEGTKGMDLDSPEWKAEYEQNQ